MKDIQELPNSKAACRAADIKQCPDHYCHGCNCSQSPSHECVGICDRRRASKALTRKGCSYRGQEEGADNPVNCASGPLKTCNHRQPLSRERRKKSARTSWRIAIRAK